MVDRIEQLSTIPFFQISTVSDSLIRLGCYDLLKLGRQSGVVERVLQSTMAPNGFNENRGGSGLLIMRFIHLAFACLIFFAIIEQTALASVPIYEATLKADKKSLEIEQGGFSAVTFRLTNHGQFKWVSASPNPVHFSYHLLDAHGKILFYDNPRAQLLQPVSPGESATLTLKIGADLFPKPGDYQLEFDLVHEGYTWFAKQGTLPLIIPVKVTPRKFSATNAGLPENIQESVLHVTNFPEFGQLWQLIRNTLAYTHQEFSIGNHHYAGFFAGSVYPQLWARDSATIMNGSRWFYPKSSLSDWLELILSHQKQDGSIPDWVNTNNQNDKNTVATDQEASLIIGAYYYYTFTGDDAWLAKPINGHSLLSRLNKALEYIWQQRRDRASELIIGAHTIDWGDVEIGECTQDAIYAGLNTVWTADIYDQAMTVLASRHLAELNNAAGAHDAAQTWNDRADRIAVQTRSYLWQPRKGYFRMHRHLGSYNHSFDEDSLFPMGGNAVAIESGIATPIMAKRIISVARQRQIKYGISTISGALLPPYPDDIYCHPAVNRSWNYQNGGQWDWFGARLILTMYEAGFSDKATVALRQIAGKSIKHFSLNEWHDREGKPKGSSWYAGNAGVLSRAIVEGYFGVYSQHDALTIRPRIKDGSASIALREPATGNHIKYDYSANQKRLLLTLRTNHSAPVTVIFTLPNKFSGKKSVLVNNQPVTHQSGKIGDDQWLRVTLSPTEEITIIEVKRG